jgi:hypothetical protein
VCPPKGVDDGLECVLDLAPEGEQQSDHDDRDQREDDPVLGHRRTVFAVQRVANALRIRRFR